MGTIIVCIVLALVIAFAVYSTIRKIKYGSSCCGGKDPMPAKIRVKDRNKSHYPYVYLLKIDGMHCSGCVRKLENAFHAQEGFWVSVIWKRRRPSFAPRKNSKEKMPERLYPRQVSPCLPLNRKRMIDGLPNIYFRRR